MKSYLLFILIVLTACSEQKTTTQSSNEACTLADAARNGFDVTNAATAQGIRNFNDVSSCEIKTCNTNYTQLPGANSCEPILCTMENTTITNLTAVTGDLVNGCVATACAWGHYLDNGICPALQCDPVFQYIDGNVCADFEIVNPQFTFVSDYSNTQMINQVSLGTTSLAQEIAIYSDASCQNNLVPFTALNSFNRNVELTSTQGIQSYYAKYKNNSKESACIGDSIVYDNISPSLAITYPTQGLTIAGNSLKIMGSCLDVNPSNINVKVDFNSQSQTVACSAGSFAATFDISALSPSLNNSITVSSTDLAANSFSTNLSFERINCSAFQNTVDNHCEYKPIEQAQFSFNLDITKELNTDISKGTTTYAQEFEVYEGNNCSNVVIPSSPIIMMDTLLLSSGDASKVYSIRYKNGDKQSDCLTDSIILDQTPPSISLNEEISGDIAGTSLLISGDCSDSNTPNLKLSYEVSSGISPVELDCSEGSYNHSIDISNLVDGNKTLKIESADIVGNKTTINKLFNKITCTSFENTVGNICEDKDILNASVAVDVQYTNSLNRQLTLTGENVQDLEVHMGQTCNNLLLSSVFQNNLAVTFPDNGDGEVNFSVKFINETKSQCISKSFILDRIAPELSAITHSGELLGTNEYFIKDNAVVLTANCSDAVAADTIEFSLTNGSFSSNKTASCVSNLNESFDITAVNADLENNFILDVIVTDKAGNKTVRNQNLNLRKGKTVQVTLNNSNPLYGTISYNYRGNTTTCSLASCVVSIYNNIPITLSYDLLYNGKFVSMNAPSCVGSENNCVLSLNANTVVNYSFAPERFLEARDDTYSVVQAETLYITASELGVNDKSLVGATFSVVSVANPQGGTVSLTGQTITFVPTVKTGTPAGFNYTIRDSANRTETAWVNVIVNPLLELQALIYDDPDEITTLIQTPPVSMATVFQQWGRLETSNGNGINRFFENLASIPSNMATCTAANVPSGCTETKAWSYNSSNGRILSTLNSSYFIGFVSPGTYENYEFEATVSSTNTDDDTIALIIAYTRVNNKNYSLILSRTQGGNSPNNGFGIYYNLAGDGAALINSISLGTVHRNQSDSNAGSGDKEGWDGRYSKLKIQRNGDIIRVFGSNFNSTNLDVSKILTVDLNSDPDLAKFKGPQKYGYGAYSQKDSTFYNTRFRSNTELDPYLIYDAENKVVWEYVAGVGWAINYSLDFEEALGYPRVITNPRTGKSYSLDANGQLTIL